MKYLLKSMSADLNSILLEMVRFMIHVYQCIYVTIFPFKLCKK